MKSLKAMIEECYMIFNSSRAGVLMGVLLLICAFESVSAQQLPTTGAIATSSGHLKDGVIKNPVKIGGERTDKQPNDKSERREPGSAELEEVRSQLQQAQQRIDEMQRQMEEMRVKLNQLLDIKAVPENGITGLAAIDKDRTGGAGGSATVSAVHASVAAPVSAQEPDTQKPKEQSTIDKLIKPKYEDGQFSGAEGLLKTDRVKVGGYMDFRFVTRGIDDGNEIRSNIAEENEGNIPGTNFMRNSFVSPRFVLGVAAALTDKLLFNSEIEFEFAGKETELEQAYIEYRFHPVFNLRGGIITPPLGRFNIFHDSNLQDIAPRPLASTFIIPSTYKDAGIGALGEFRLGSQVRLGYEGYVTNGLRSDEGGEITRAAGIFESKGNN